MKTALVAIGRRENQYAREWVQHHLAQGFDHIYIYDNNHDGEDRFDTVLGDFVAETGNSAPAGFPSGNPVTIIPYRNRNSAQRDAYNDAYARFGQNYDWLAFFDFDEFLCFTPAASPSSIAGDCIAVPATVPAASPAVTPSVRCAAAAPLPTFLATIPPHYHAVMIPWLMMTDSGLIHNDHRPLMTRFTQSTTNGGGQGKCIVRTRIPGLRFTRSVHIPYEPVLNCCTPRLQPTLQKRHQPQDTTVAYLKHFSTKTIEEWLTNKWQKGAAGIPYATFLQKYQDYFFRINERTPEKEAFIQEWRKHEISK